MSCNDPTRRHEALEVLHQDIYCPGQAEGVKAEDDSQRLFCGEKYNLTCTMMTSTTTRDDQWFWTEDM